MSNGRFSGVSAQEEVDIIFFAIFMIDILQKIEAANLRGRGGACFPVVKKWQMVKDAVAEKKFVVCNVSEGEPGVHKDKYILDYHMEEVIDGIKIALWFLNASHAYFYVNQKYYNELHHRLRNIIKDAPITIFEKDHSAGYIAGEETSALNHIEGKKVEPRLRPPFPTTNGLWGFPTLINNLETFYDVALVAKGKYKEKRFFSLGGDCLNRGVYELPENMTVAEVLRVTKNFPDFDFFVQVGGDASGIVWNAAQLEAKATGSASITVYSAIKHQPIDLIRNWAKFFKKESCGQCTPCREGTSRLVEILDAREINWEMCGDILNNLSETSFCGLGTAASIAIKSYVKNVLMEKADNRIIIPNISNEFICDCFNEY